MPLPVDFYEKAKTSQARTILQALDKREDHFLGVWDQKTLLNLFDDDY